MLRRLPRHRLRFPTPTTAPTTPLLILRSSSTAASSTTNTSGVPIKDPAATSLESATGPSAGEAVSLGNQAPNRAVTWARSQMPRAEAMVGPRFEQTDLELQPRPLAAIGLIHEQPVRFVKEHVVVCDGGGGPLGHPKIFINVDKPEVTPCGYCGLPFAHIGNKKEILAKGQGPHGNYVIEE